MEVAHVEKIATKQEEDPFDRALREATERGVVVGVGVESMDFERTGGQVYGRIVSIDRYGIAKLSSGLHVNVDHLRPRSTQ